MKTPKKKTSISLTPQALHLLKLLATSAGVSMTAWLETQIRAAAKRERIRDPLLVL